MRMRCSAGERWRTLLVVMVSGLLLVVDDVAVAVARLGARVDDSVHLLGAASVDGEWLELCSDGRVCSGR